MPVDLEKLLTVQEAMSYLRVGRTTLQRMMKSRKIAFVRVGRKVYFTQANLEAYIRKNTVAAKK